MPTWEGKMYRRGGNYVHNTLHEANKIATRLQHEQQRRYEQALGIPQLVPPPPPPMLVPGTYAENQALADRQQAVERQEQKQQATNNRNVMTLQEAIAQDLNLAPTDRVYEMVDGKPVESRIAGAMKTNERRYGLAHIDADFSSSASLQRAMPKQCVVCSLPAVEEHDGWNYCESCAEGFHRGIPDAERPMTGRSSFMRKR